MIWINDEKGSLKRQKKKKKLRKQTNGKFNDIDSADENK
jgi:hypothetical protein